MSPRLRARRAQADRFLDSACRWATRDDAVRGLALVGSTARGATTMASDVDLIVLTLDLRRYTESAEWITALAEPTRLIRTARWGAVTERRLRLRSGLHIDLGFTTPDWAALPLDSGTRRVLTDGHRILYDPEHHLQRAALAAGAGRAG